MRMKVVGEYLSRLASKNENIFYIKSYRDIYRLNTDKRKGIVYMPAVRGKQKCSHVSQKQIQASEIRRRNSLVGQKRL